jgi:geranylgeranyl pyrophosphate synthase
VKMFDSCKLRGVLICFTSAISQPNKVLSAAAQYFFEIDKGKKIRPATVLLMAGVVREATAFGSGGALADIGAASFEAVKGSSQWKQQQKLAELTEMLHTAALLHEDVIDLSSQRRATSINSIFGNKLAVLAGDFLLARTSVSLGYLRNCQVVELMTTVLEHLVHGEVMAMQMSGGVQPKQGGATAESKLDISGDISATRGDYAQYESTDVYEQYLERQYFKTGSLIANSCRSSLVLANAPLDQQQHAFAFGKHLAMALQLSDDALDFEQNGCQSAQLGVATAPLLLALRGEVAAREEQTADCVASSTSPYGLDQLLQRRLAQPGDVEEAMQRVHQADGVRRTRKMADEEAVTAVDSLRLLIEAVQQHARAEKGLPVATSSELQAFEENSKYYHGLRGLCMHVLTKRE